MLSGLYDSLAVLSHAEYISSTDKDTRKDLKHVLHADELQIKKNIFLVIITHPVIMNHHYTFSWFVCGW